MAQTAMQDLIQRLNESAKSYKEAGEDLYAAALLNSAILAMHLLEKEKQQIIAAWEDISQLPNPCESGEEYYNKTYGA